MTPEEQLHQRQLERQQASQDLGDIDFLSKCEPFNRYWVRRLNDLFRMRVLTCRTGGNAEVREKARIEANILEELTKMPAQDRSVAHALATSEVPQMPKPTQAM